MVPQNGRDYEFTPFMSVCRSNFCLKIPFPKFGQKQFKWPQNEVSGTIGTFAHVTPYFAVLA